MCSDFPEVFLDGLDLVFRCAIESAVPPAVVVGVGWVRVVGALATVEGGVVAFLGHRWVVRIGHGLDLLGEELQGVVAVTELAQLAHFEQCVAQAVVVSNKSDVPIFKHLRREQAVADRPGRWLTLAR